MNNNWYTPNYTPEEDWYAPLQPVSSVSTSSSSEDDSRLLRRKKTTRIIAFILIIALLASTFAYTVIPRGGRARPVIGSGDWAESEEQEEFPEQFGDFFSQYYTSTENEKVDVRIPDETEDLRFELSLAQSAGEDLTLQEIYKRCSGSIVAIAGYTDGMSGYNWGTGVVLSSDGLILTNTHVIDGCDSAEVVIDDTDRYKASLVGADAISDLAVLKIDAEGLACAEFGDSTVLSVGDRVAAIGNPLGDEFTRTLTDGIISAIDRDISYNGRNMTLIQTNAALNEGNSGGALFNMHGQVIGITNMKMMSSLSSIEGIGFAIPSSTVQKVTASLVKYGEVKGRPSIGITVGQIPTNAMEHYSMPEGLYVAAVSEGSDAEKQGIRVGDVITAVEGQNVTTTEEVVAIKDAHAVGDRLTFSIWRPEETLEITITLMDTNDIYG